MSDSPQYTVDATETSLAIFETLVENGEPMGVTALASRVETSKSVVHNHLSTLRTHGYVVKQESEYRPSLRSLELGDRTRAEMPVYQAAKHELDNLAAATDETTTLFGLEANEGVPIYIAETEDGWTPQFREGERLSLHVNAPGKALLASLPDEHLDRILNGLELTTATDATITDPKELKTQIRRIRDDGIAFCRQEQYEDIVGVAAPIRSVSGHRVAALGVCGPTERLNRRYLEEDIVGQVLSTAKSIQVELTSG